MELLNKEPKGQVKNKTLCGKGVAVPMNKPGRGSDGREWVSAQETESGTDSQEEGLRWQNK